MTEVSQATHRVTVRCPVCDQLTRVDLDRLGQSPKCARCGRPLHLDRPLKTGDADFEETIRTAEAPVLVDFHADWCGPCHMMAPVLDEFAHAQTGRVLVLKLNTDHNPQTTQRFQIRGIPALIVFREGREVGRHVGVADRATLEGLVVGQVA